MKNNKKVYFILHPGYPRTGTTWLQTEVASKLSILNLGKENSKYLNTNRESLLSKQRRIFSSFSDPFSQINRYKNSNEFIDDYVFWICKFIESEISIKDKLVVLLSDETILGYGGLEINLFLLLHRRLHSSYFLQ